MTRDTRVNIRRHLVLTEMKSIDAKALYIHLGK